MQHQGLTTITLGYLVEMGTRRRGMTDVDGVRGGANWQGGGVPTRPDGEKKNRQADELQGVKVSTKQKRGGR